MSTLDEKLERAESSGGAARCMYRKHLAYRNPIVTERDNVGPKVVVVLSMGKEYTWKRVGTHNGDYVMELQNGR